MKYLLLLLYLCVGSIYCANTGLKVVPGNIAVQNGETVSLKCQHYPKDPAADLKLDWFMPDGNIPISKLIVNQSVINMTQSNILRFKSENGTLTIVNATSNDAGTYKCKKGDSAMETESIVKVYTMTSYTTGLIVVLVINGVLVLIFIMCSIWSYVREHKKTKKKNRKLKLGHRELLKQ